MKESDFELDYEIFREIDAAIKTLEENGKSVNDYYLYVSRRIWEELGRPEYFECGVGKVPVIVVDELD